MAGNNGGPPARKMTSGPGLVHFDGLCTLSGVEELQGGTGTCYNVINDR